MTDKAPDRISYMGSDYRRERPGSVVIPLPTCSRCGLVAPKCRCGFPAWAVRK